MRILLIGLALVSTTPSATAGARDNVRPAVVEGTRLVVTDSDGTKVTGEDLVGAIIVGNEDDGHSLAFRIDQIRKDTDDPTGETFLYTFSAQDEKSHEWKPYCMPDHQGLAAGFPLAGTWNKNGRHIKSKTFTVACTSGVIGKCVRIGYRPWQKAKDGHSMWDYHQACTRMFRADYCGDGLGHTRDGTPIDITDRMMPVDEFPKDMKFEAAWTPDGAWCVAKMRLPSPPAQWTLQTLEKQCPRRLKGHLGDPATCNKQTGFKNKNVLLINRSR